MGRKLGLADARDGDASLIEDLQARMAANGADFTLTFRRLGDVAVPEGGPEGDAAIRELFAEPGDFDAWAMRWRKRLAREDRDPVERRTSMLAFNPAFIPRNHLVEEAIRAAVDAGDFAPFEALVTVLGAAFADQPGFARHALPPTPDQVVRQTFCGT
jgi:uncharacterized protein YdiU (UPF0061 family)